MKADWYEVEDDVAVAVGDATIHLHLDGSRRWRMMVAGWVAEDLMKKSRTNDFLPS